MKLIIFFLLFYTTNIFAKINVVTTVTDLTAIVTEVGDDKVSVASLAKGSQDPHFIEAKPSFMVTVSKADLVIAIGLDLEVGYLPLIIQGARNPKVNQNEDGYLEVGPLVSPIEVMTDRVSRADGDVHPYGNPHILLDPIRAGDVAIAIADRLAKIDPANGEFYKKRAAALKLRLEEKSKRWADLIKQSNVTKIVSYHKTLNYFFDRFKIKGVATLEPKPGIPPTASHIMEVLSLIKKEKIPLVLIENYFDGSLSKKITDESPTTRVEIVPVSVDGASNVRSIDDLYENLVNKITNNKR